jgi:hypothetical protein
MSDKGENVAQAAFQALKRIGTPEALAAVREWRAKGGG